MAIGDGIKRAAEDAVKDLAASSSEAKNSEHFDTHGRADQGEVVPGEEQERSAELNRPQAAEEELEHARHGGTDRVQKMGSEDASGSGGANFTGNTPEADRPTSAFGSSLNDPSELESEGSLGQQDVEDSPDRSV